jgi:osmoprotectant transport system substrate-binding protein
MRQVYGLDKLTYVPLTIEQRYGALRHGRVDVIAVFTTEGQLIDRKQYTLLSDPKGIFGFQNIVPVVSRKVLREQGPAFRGTVNAVSAKLTNDALQSMNAAVDLRRQKPAAVARAFLQRSGLL